MEKVITSTQRARILAINRETAQLYHSVLYSDQGKNALDYCHSRGYTDTTIKRFGIGYAPDNFWFLRDELRKKGFHDDELRAAWLCGLSQKGRLYDLFRNRVMIPIIDVQGNVIAFGGRVLDDSKPKYLNSGETPVFKKTHNLFALNLAKQNTQKQLIICEGYMDAIALHQAGVTNTVAALGTSFTADQARLVAQFADEVVLVFDADDAGQKAVQRASQNLKCLGVAVRVVAIPDAKDPDDFIRKNGADSFKDLLDNAMNDIEYKLLAEERKINISSDTDKIKYLSLAAEIIASSDDVLMRDFYIGKLSDKYSVTRVALTQVVEEIRKKNRTKRDGNKPNP